VKLAAMQPYFFPYLGYFDLINMVDEWIVFDTPQYMKYGWVNRNRVLHPTSGWQYIIMPLKKHHHTTPINQVEISMNTDWATVILRQLGHYRKDAPFYDDVIAFLKDCFSDLNTNLAEVNTSLFKKTCQRLGIDKPIRVYSKTNLTLKGPVNSPGDWGLRIAQAAGASEFINRPGGAAFLDENSFLEHGIKLTIQSFANMTYDCGRHKYEPDLSIIDVMMWNSSEKIKHYLDTCHLRTERGDARLLHNGVAA
jgi:hypothetical protein